MKRILSILLVLMLMLGCLCSCFDLTDGNKVPDQDVGGNTPGDDSGDDGAGGPVDYGTATVFVPGDTVQIIAPSGDARAVADQIKSELDEMLMDAKGNGGATIGSVYSMNADREIIIGYVDETRPATVRAQELMNRMERESYFTPRYLVYASEGCIAVVSDSVSSTSLKLFDIIAEDVILPLFEGKDYVAYAEGIIASGDIDLIAIQEELDNQILVDAWNTLEAAIGTEATDAMRKVYSMYGKDLAGWVASLYDPGTGGFYASAGGRDGVEFGPDVQCTVQLLRFIESSGMVNNIEGGAINYIPEFMQQQMIYFGKSLQDPGNGYFYHPQWGKALTDTHLSRRGRDLGWATDLLSTFGSDPAYDAPNGRQGDGITADEYWQSLVDSGEALGPKPYPSTETPTIYDIKSGDEVTEPLGSDAAKAVSKIIAVDSAEDAEVDSSTAYLKSYTAFIDYLLVTVGPGLDSNPYSAGNNLNATYSQIASWSSTLVKEQGVYSYTEGDELTSTNAAVALKQLRANADNDSSNDLSIADVYKFFDGRNLKDMTIALLNEKINPEIGLWGVVSTKNPTGTEFLFTNGYFKIITLYNSWRYPYPAEYIDDAANALMTGLMGDEPSTGNICEVYNVWTAISSTKSNLDYLADSALRDSVSASIDKILEEGTAAALLNTYEKVKGYKKYDGGFAHGYNQGTANHQGLPVGQSALNQSDVDATCIGSTGLTNAIFRALDLIDIKVPLLTESDFMKMIETFMTMDRVVKYSYDDVDGSGSGKTEYHTFETDLPSAQYFKYNSAASDNTFTNEVAGDGNSFGLLNKASAGNQAYLDFKINETSVLANSVVYESDIMISDVVSASEPIELRLYNGTTSDTRIYTLYIYASSKTAGSPIYVAPKSDTNSKIKVGEIGKWFNLALVYFGGVEGDDKAPAAFKVYIDGKATPVIVDEKFESGSAINARQVGFARFLTMSAFRGKISVDNIRFAHEVREYVYEAPTHNAGSSGGSSTPSTPSTPSSPSTPTTPTGSTSTTKDNKVTFDGATAFPVTADNGIVISNNSQKTWKGGVTLEKEGDNSYIHILDPLTTSEKDPDGDGGQCILLFDRPDYTGTDGTFVFEAKFRITPLADGTIADKPGFFDITLRNAAGTRVYRAYFGGGNIALNKVIPPTGNLWKAGEWFTIRIEYTVSGADAASATWNVKAFVNDQLVSQNSDATAEAVYADSLGIDKVGILLSREVVGQLDIDDVTMYQKSAQ